MNFIDYNPCTRLGNWMFQIAFARMLGPYPIAFHVKNGIPLTLLEETRELYPDVTYAHELPDDVTEYEEADLVRNGFRLPEKRDNLFSKSLFQFQSIYDRASCIRDFACPDRIRKIIDAKYGEALSAPLTVGISVRRGDYLAIPHLHPFVGETYLKCAVNLFDEKAVYIVCSDDIPWCKGFFSKPCFSKRRFVFVEGEEVLTQLFVHTRCKHNIISNSTFSWWGAFLNVNADRRVIFPDKWFGITNLRNKNHLVLPEAEIVHCRHSPAQMTLALALNCRKRTGDVLRSLHLRRPRTGVLPDFFK